MESINNYAKKIIYRKGELLFSETKLGLEELIIIAKLNSIHIGPPFVLS